MSEKDGFPGRLLKDLKQYWKGLAIAAAVILLLNLAFGTVCPFRILFGTPCPGCGMTRALLLLLRLDFRGALSMHPLSPFFFVLFLLFPFFRYGKTDRTGLWVRLCAVLLFLLLPVYLFRMLRVFPGEAPMDLTFADSLLGRLVRFFLKQK